MFFFIGLLLVFGSVIGGYLGGGGHLSILWMPFEFLIIFGAGLGSVVIGNPKTVLAGLARSFGPLLKGAKYNKAHYLELIGCLYSVFRLAKTKGDLALESHVENPKESSLFANYPTFMKDHHAVEFLCDYVRLLTLGTNNPHELDAVMDEELETHHNEMHTVSGAITTLADGLPALGIVAAVLGVIHTMGSITEPPEILGHLIGGALVGTFSGVLGAYGVVGPMARSIELTFDAEAKYLRCIKVAIVAHVQGYAPQVLGGILPQGSELECQADLCGSGEHGAESAGPRKHRLRHGRKRQQLHRHPQDQESRPRPPWRLLEGRLRRLRDGHDGVLPAAVAAELGDPGAARGDLELLRPRHHLQDDERWRRLAVRSVDAGLEGNAFSAKFGHPRTAGPERRAGSRSREHAVPSRRPRK